MEWETVGEPARFRLKVRHYGVDGYGHVNHATYLHYLEAARLEALAGLGIPLEEIRRRGYLILATEVAVRFHTPAYSGETLEIATFIRELRPVRSVWVQEVREVSSGRLVARGQVTGVFVTQGGQPVGIPDVFREKLAMLYVPPAEKPKGPVDPAATS